MKILFVSSRLKVVNKPLTEMLFTLSSEVLSDNSNVFAFNRFFFSASIALRIAARGKCFGNIAMIGTKNISKNPSTIHPKYLKYIVKMSQVITGGLCGKDGKLWNYNFNLQDLNFNLKNLNFNSNLNLMDLNFNLLDLSFNLKNLNFNLNLTD